MSLARQFMREFRPLFRMLEEPFGRQYPAIGTFPRNSPLSFFNDPFFAGSTAPPVDLSEEGNYYVVEAELPGVKKENVEIRIGDNGQSLTIEGRTFTRSRALPEGSEAPKAVEEGRPQNVNAAASEGSSNAVAQTNSDAPTQLSTERTFTGSSTFSRSIWLPRRVDSNEVSAKLADGILTVRVRKAEDSESVKINID